MREEERREGGGGGTDLSLELGLQHLPLPAGLLLLLPAVRMQPLHLLLQGQLLLRRPGRRWQDRDTQL